jgi:hypothetical protein
MRSIPLIVLLVVALSLTASQLQAQAGRPDVDDTFRELEDSLLTLNFFNALTGTPLSEAEVILEGVGTYKTNAFGKASFPILEDGTYQATFSREGFITSSFNIEIMAGSIFFNRFSVSPSLALGSLRIVLDWDKQPDDIDAHLVKRGDYHISYRNMAAASDGAARLDRDDRDGFGPETITTARVDQNGEYHFFIHDYTHRSDTQSKALCKSKATVKIFGRGNMLLHVFQIPRDKSGKYWHVFSLKRGEIVPVNVLSGSEPGF